MPATKRAGHHHGEGLHRSSFSISTKRFSKVDPSLLQNTYARFTAILLLIILLIWLFPDVRQAILPTFGLGAAYTSTKMKSYTYIDLADSVGTAKGWEREERILFCAPLRDAAVHLPMFVSHLRNFTYPHHLIDLAFLVSDSKDNTLGELVSRLDELQADPDEAMHFGDITILEKDFGQSIAQSFSDRHGFAAQGPRRKLMARARNWLLSAALRADHSWVYWRDVDVETAPATILEDLMRHNKDIIVPNVWRPLPDWLGGQQPYDLNSWQESETALQLAATLDEDAVIVEGYAEFATWRPHLAYLRDPFGDPEEEMPIDGIGGVSILAKAKTFRAGAHFPAFSFEKHAETEGFGKLAKRMGYSVVGLPHYVVWHLYEPSVDDIKHMEDMEAEKVAKEQKEAQDLSASLGRSIAEQQWIADKTALEAQGAVFKPRPAAKSKTQLGGVAGPVAHVGEAIAQIKDPAVIAEQLKSGQPLESEEVSENGFAAVNNENQQDIGIGGVKSDNEDDKIPGSGRKPLRALKLPQA